jgi:hypothetical protein
VKINRKVVAVAAGVAAAAGIAFGATYAIGGSGEKVSGPAADDASAAALAFAGGGTVTAVEKQDGDGPGAYEAEVKRDDGSQIEVHLDSDFQPLGSAADDDQGEGADDDAGEGAGG